MLQLTDLTNVKLKQLIWPGLWCTLLFLFLTDTFNFSAQKTNGSEKIQKTGNLEETGNSDTIDTNATKAMSLSETISNKVNDYLDGFIHTSKEPMVVDPSIVTANVSTSIKAAVIIETRQSGAFIPLILHFAAVLGPDWPVIIYTTSENFGSFSTSHSLLRMQKAGRVVVRSLEPGTFFPSWDSVSYFLTKKWLWENLAPAEHILIFQNDAILCSNSVRSVEDFFEYDLIGAPIAGNWGRGYNGGLSLRKRSTTLRALEKFDWTKAVGMRAEDQWYYARFLDLKTADEAEGIVDGIKLPSMEVARTFAVETIDYPRPLGFHQPTRFIQNHMLALDEWCPEYKLARADRNF